MTLTYTEHMQKTTYEKREHTLDVPLKWGMFTSQGNNRMKTKASSLVKNLEKAETYSKKIAAFEKYFKAYSNARNSNSECMSEAGDTEVRERVWCFAIKAGQAVNIDSSVLDNLWENIL